MSLLQQLVARVRRLRARWFAPPSEVRRVRSPTGLPEWARAGRKRRAHIKRVAALLEEWADAMEAPPAERRRWLRACWLHDALRGAELAPGLTHGGAAADRAEELGETDRGVLDAVRYHSVGYAEWDDVGKMLYLADFLEPGRKSRRKQRSRWAKQVPRNRDRVLREIVSLQMRSRLRAHRLIDPHTAAFWNSLMGQ